MYRGIKTLGFGLILGLLALAGGTGRSAELPSVGDLLGRVAALQEGIVDLVIATMTITQSRLQQIDFSDVYYEGAQMLLVPRTSEFGSDAPMARR